MKKIIVLSLITLLLSSQTSIVVATGSSSNESSDSAELKTIEKIKDMVADKVSKLNIIEKRGFIGTVQDVSNTQITVQDIHGKKRFIDIDELTKFQESIGSSKTFGISDIEKGDELSFVGQYNKDTERLLARFVTYTTSIPEYISGTVTNIDTKNFTITVTTSKNEKYTIDIERSTNTRSYEAEEGLQKSGFSQIKEGEKVLVVGFPDEEEDKRYAASRVLHFINSVTETPGEEE